MKQIRSTFMLFAQSVLKRTGWHCQPAQVEAGIKITKKCAHDVDVAWASWILVPSWNFVLRPAASKILVKKTRFQTFVLQSGTDLADTLR
jgi:hypothetical protein